MCFLSSCLHRKVLYKNYLLTFINSTCLLFINTKLLHLSNSCFFVSYLFALLQSFSQMGVAFHVKKYIKLLFFSICLQALIWIFYTHLANIWRTSTLYWTLFCVCLFRILVVRELWRIPPLDFIAMLDFFRGCPMRLEFTLLLEQVQLEHSTVVTVDALCNRQ